MAFDIQSARSAGYSDAEIADFMAKDNGFDADGARSSGYSDSEIIDHLSTSIRKATQAQQHAQMSHEAPTSSSTAEGFMRGMKDPIDAGAQMLTHALPSGLVEAGNRLNNQIADSTGMVQRIPQGGMDQMLAQEEADYQRRRQEAGRDGMDGARVMGNIAAMAPAAYLAPATTSLGGAVAVNAGIGGAMGAMQPVYEGDFAEGKRDQILYGAGTGAAVTPLAHGLARVIAPKAASNPDVALLRKEGINPTIGQTLGGMAARMEEKAQSIPFLGDAITAARLRATHEFNTAAINRAVKPIGEKVEGVGTDAVKEAGDKLSKSYKVALKGLQGVRLDQTAVQEFIALGQMSQGLPKQTQQQFKKVMEQFVFGRMNNRASMHADTFKIIDSDIGYRAARYGKSSIASEQELGDALLEAQRILRDAAARQNPKYAAALDASNEGWANLVRIEQAAKMAAGEEGVFRPSQLLSAIKSGDKSTRGRAVARGDALMQDLGVAGQKVLAGKTPNSGTVDRALMLGTGGGLMASPLGTIAALTGGSAVYSKPVQNALVYAATRRPQSSNALARVVRKAAPLASAGSSQ